MLPSEREILLRLASNKTSTVNRFGDFWLLVLRFGLKYLGTSGVVMGEGVLELGRFDV